MSTRTANRRIALTMVLGLGGLAAASGIASCGINRWTTGGPAPGGVGCLAVDSEDPRVLYAAGGTRVFKSADAGLDWDELSAGKLGDVDVHSLAVDPKSSSTLYAGTARGIAKSTDGGSTFRATLASAAIYNLIFASQKSVIYAADFDDVSYYPNPSNVYASTDDGETWTKKPVPISIVPGSLIVDPTQPSALYAAAYDDFWGIYGSLDGGTTWRAVSSDLRALFVSALAMGPQVPSRLYAAAFSGGRDGRNVIYRSEDGGSTWLEVSTDLPNTFVNALVVDPRNSNTLYVAGFQGVFQSTDGGTRWRDFNRGLPARDIIALGIDSSGRTLHAGSRNLGVFDYRIFSGAVDVSVGSDGQARLLFFGPDGGLLIRGVAGSGNSSSIGPFGPYSDWDPRAAANGADGLTRVLWANDNGTAALWLVGSEGVQTAYTLGDSFAGWTALDVAASVANRSDVLWRDAHGRIAIWNVSNAGDVRKSPAWGPYAGWNAVAIADGKDGLSRVLWTRADGSAALSFFGPEGLVASYPFGPVAGWTAVDIAVGADGQSRILWTHRDGRMALWRVDDAGNPTVLGPIYGPPPGLSAVRIAAGPDGRTRVLWANTGGSATLWTMSADNVLLDSVVLEP